MQRALSFIQYLLRGATNDHRTCLALSHATKAHERVLANHHFLNHRAPPNLHMRRVVKRGRNFGAKSRRKTLDTLKVRVLNRHDPRIRKQLCPPNP